MKDWWPLMLVAGLVVILLLRSKKAAAAASSAPYAGPDSSVPGPVPPHVTGGFGAPPAPGYGSTPQPTPTPYGGPPAPQFNVAGGSSTGGTGGIGIQSTFFGRTVDVSDGTIQSLQSLLTEAKASYQGGGCAVSGNGCLSAADTDAAAAYIVQQDAVQASYGRGYGR